MGLQELESALKTKFEDVRLGLVKEVPPKSVPQQTQEAAREMADDLLEQAKWAAELARRRGHVVIGALGGKIRSPQLFSLDEAVERQEAGFNVPLDLMPVEFWHRQDPDTFQNSDISILPFSEEALGDAF